jgi:hypothetical protein
MLQVYAGGFQICPGQCLPGCTGPGAGSVGLLRANAVVTSDGAISLVRPAAGADGNFEVRIQQGTVTPERTLSVTGRISGTVVNAAIPVIFPLAAHDGWVTFAGALPIEGAVYLDSRLATGTLSGTMTIGNSAGFSLVCESVTVMWELNRLSL